MIPVVGTYVGAELGGAVGDICGNVIGKISEKSDKSERKKNILKKGLAAISPVTENLPAEDQHAAENVQTIRDIKTLSFASKALRKFSSFKKSKKTDDQPKKSEKH